MPNWDDPFVPAYDEIIADKEETYENALVKQLLKLTGRLPEQRKLLGQTADQLQFYAFAQHIGFPMWLEHRQVKADADSFYQLFGAITKSAIYQTYLSVRENTPVEYADLHAGLVFRWTGWAKFIVFHDRPPLRSSGGGQARFWLGKGKQVFVLERLEDLILELGGPEAFSN